MDVAGILSELSDHGFADTSDARKMSKLNQAYHQVNSLRPWPYLAKELVLTFNGASSAPTNLPTDFKAVLSVTHPTNGKVSHQRLDQLRRVYSDLTQVGDAMYFYFVGLNLRAYPRPNNGATLTLDYIHKPVDLLVSDAEAAIKIPSQYHQVLVDGTLYKLYAMEDDPELAAFFRQEYIDRIREMDGDLWQQQYSDPNQINVIDPADFDYSSSDINFY